MIYSLFVSPIVAAWDADVNDPTQGNFVGQMLNTDRQNVLYYRIEKCILASSATRAITLANYVRTEWLYLIVRVNGLAYIATAGKDTDGSSAITGKLQAYGTDLLPGISIFSSYNVDTMTITSQADDTEVEVFAAVACADDDTRYTTNA